MRNRCVSLLPAIAGAVLAGLASTAQADPAVPAKDCLTSPGQPASGGHWYYRIERGTKRHCWYVRGEDQSTTQLAASSAKSTAPATSTALQPSVADARAEIAAVAEAVPMATASVATAAADSAQPSNPSSASVADRWSDYPNADAAPMAAPPGLAARPQQQPASAKPADSSAAYPVWMLLSVVVGALALVGIASAVIANFGGRIAIGDHDDEAEPRRSIWDAPPREDASSPASADDETPLPNWVRIARETQARQETNRRAEQVEHLLARGSGRAV